METSLTRRGFNRLLGLGVASAALRPAFPAGALPLAAQAAVPAGAAGVVRLSSNENPYGPSPAALEAMRKAFDLAWRYPDEAAEALAADLAKLHGVSTDHVLLGDGSSEILKLCATAFTGPGRAAVTADPTFEAVARYAQIGGAEVVKAPLTASHRHDLAKMLPAGSGLVYVCNPNNPTASLTPGADLRAFLDRVPAGTMVLVDEAYAHYAAGDEWESVLPQVKDRPNLIVARTFSKIYGMAGLRCGYAVAQPEAIRRLRDHQAWDSLNIMAIAAARASLADAGHVETSRRLNRETRAFVSSGLESMGYPPIPSATNFLMTDLRRDVGPVIAALKQRGVEVGRRFPAMPSFLRVTVGTRPQMGTFLAALRAVLA
ncbi:MAG TPA: aminotransferase class I/II-fold pyridoxal phosphate-dependent enzyme [Thermoanaerobaculia bacterium]